MNGPPPRPLVTLGNVSFVALIPPLPIPATATPPRVYHAPYLAIAESDDVAR